MKKLLLFTLLFFINNCYANYYKIYVKRIDKDLYLETNSDVYIKTRFCYEYTYGEDAILKYDRYSLFDNKIMFNNNGSCDVEKLFK